MCSCTDKSTLKTKVIDLSSCFEDKEQKLLLAELQSEFESVSFLAEASKYSRKKYGCIKDSTF